MSLLSDNTALAPPPTRTAAVPAQRSSGDNASMYKWVAIESALFPGEGILCVLDPACLDEARAENPDLVAYTMAEIDLLYPIREQRERIQALHRVKKKFGGWVREV